ncbi:MAG: DUF1844 domain-containing protein [Pirellulaceae bacterium]
MTDTDKPDSDDEKKIVVDTDWKEQVAKEKEQAAAVEAADASKADFVPMDKDAQSKPPTPANVDDDDDAPEMAPPPASFEVLISMLFTQAMACLGQMPNPATGKPEINKPFAKHYIDTLEMLGEKTKGNTTDDESKMLGEAMHALRMAYVSVKAPS